MPEGRPEIPAALVRALMIEAGHRCAIPTCRLPEPLQIEHIEEWSKVGEHTFDNMIVLCANCHARKKDTANPRHLDRKALRQYKANLGLLNARYGDFERRVIEMFAEEPNSRFIDLTGGSDVNRIQLRYLLRDGMLAPAKRSGAEVHLFGIPMHEAYFLTDKGVELVEQWKNAQPIEST